MRVAVIPARGGSKRIPRKNIREFAGRPMISYSIDCALSSGLFQKVIVSTDDDEIAAIATRFGAEVPFRRPAHLADDHTATTEVVAHAIEEMQKRDLKMESVCCIYGTAPFIRAEDLESGLRTLESEDWLYVFAATGFGYPVQRSFQLEPGGGVKMLMPEHFHTRSQDLPETMHDAGQFYWGRAGAWLQRHRIFSDRCTVVRIPRWRVQDIDTEEDWIRAQLMAEALGLHG